MWVMSCIWDDWLIPHLIANSSTFVVNIFIIWWIVFAIISCSLYICETKVVVLFLTLVSDTMNTVSWLLDDSLWMSLSLFQ